MSVNQEAVQAALATVILAKTIKGWTLGSHFEARNSTHQMKKMTLDDLKNFRDRLFIPLKDEELDAKLPKAGC